MKSKVIYIFGFVDDKFGSIETFFDSKGKLLGFVDKGSTPNFDSLKRMYKVVNIKLHFLPLKKEPAAIKAITREIGKYEFVKRYEKSLKHASHLRLE